MTSIICWPDHVEIPGVWAAADSRISVGGSTTLLDSAAKIFSVPIICRKPGPNRFFDTIYFSHSIGMCVAGSAIVALNLNAVLTPILSQLIAIPRDGDDAVPSIKEVSDLVLRLLRRFVCSVGDAIGRAAFTEVCVFGFCHRVQWYQLFRLTPQTEPSGVEISCASVDLSRPEAVVVMGVRQNEISAFIVEERLRLSSRDIAWSRTPERILRRLIADNTFPSIGGHVQLGRATSRGMELFFRLQPRVKDQPEAVAEYLGLDLEGDIGSVGPCRPGMLGMA